MIQQQTPKELKLAYIAGFIDGDGCIHHSNLRARSESGVLIGVTDVEPVQFIANHFNKNVTKRLEKSPYKVKPRYFTKCSGISVIPHLKSLLPFLMKKETTLLKFLNNMMRMKIFPTSSILEKNSLPGCQDFPKRKAIFQLEKEKEFELPLLVKKHVIMPLILPINSLTQMKV